MEKSYANFPNSDKDVDKENNTKDSEGDNPYEDAKDTLKNVKDLIINNSFESIRGQDGFIHPSTPKRRKSNRGSEFSRFKFEDFQITIPETGSNEKSKQIARGSFCVTSNDVNIFIFRRQSTTLKLNNGKEQFANNLRHL